MPLALLMHVAGARGEVEDGFAGGKEPTALDEHQIRSWTSWRRWTILALLAHASLSILASQAAADHPGDGQLIPLTRHEIRHLLTGLSRQLATPAADPEPMNRQPINGQWKEIAYAVGELCSGREPLIAHAEAAVRGQCRRPRRPRPPALGSASLVPGVPAGWKRGPTALSASRAIWSPWWQMQVAVDLFIYQGLCRAPSPYLISSTPVSIAARRRS